MVEAASLYNSSYFRLPTKLPEKPLLQRANLNTSIDFLDSIDEDFPQGTGNIFLVLQTVKSPV